MNFIEYLINKGYKSYRKVYDKTLNPINTFLIII